MAFFSLLSPRAFGIPTNVFQCKWFSIAFMLLHFCVNYIILFTFPSCNINCPLSPQIVGKVRSPTFTLGSFRDCHRTMKRYKKYWFIVPILTNINGYWVIQIKQYFYARNKSASQNTQTSVRSDQISHSVVSDSLWSHECSTPGLPVHHQLPEFTQTHVHWVSDAIQPSHPLSSPSPPVPNPSQHQSLFQWVNSSHEVAKVLEFQL